MLRDRLVNEKKEKLVFWIQQVLIECYYIKLNLMNNHRPDFPIMEPISHHCICEDLIYIVVRYYNHSNNFLFSTVNNLPIPLVPFSSEQNQIMVYQPFVLLLHKLGFQLPADANRLFVRIPDFWTMEILLKVAQTLGPIPKGERLKKAFIRFIKLLNKLFTDFLKFDIDSIDPKSDTVFDSATTFATQSAFAESSYAHRSVHSKS